MALPTCRCGASPAELGVQPSALYHDFAKRAAARPWPTSCSPAAPAARRADVGCAGRRGLRGIRDAMLAYRDGAELVATVHAFGLVCRALSSRLAGALSAPDLDALVARSPPRTLLLLRLRTRSGRADAPAGGQRRRDRRRAARPGRRRVVRAPGLTLILDGIRQHQSERGRLSALHAPGAERSAHPRAGASLNAVRRLDASPEAARGSNIDGGRS